MQAGEEVSLSPEAAKAMIRRWWQALAANRVDEVAALMSDDIVWEIKFVGHYLPDQGVTRGKENSLKNNVGMFAAMYDLDRLDVEITNMISDGRTVVIEFQIDGYTAAGARYDKVEYVTIVEIEAGLVKCVREYMDALKAKSAHGL